jgi:hypothetical protein
MRTDWILFTLLGLLWLGAGGIHLKLPRRQKDYPSDLTEE